MRLLDVHTYPPPLPEDKLTRRRYAILSHTWQETEIVFSDLSTKDSVFQARLRRDLDSWRKIRGAQKRAKEDGFDFIWIDTLCIDKSSSTELSEAINSMYRWYQEAEVCYVYLADVKPIKSDSTKTEKRQCLEQSRWFKRGWTLQELIAPKLLYFFDTDWNLIGSREELLEIVSNICRIDAQALYDAPLQSYSIAQRMSWAAGRETTRSEDRAYSLLGILGVSLDIRYGEGAAAFIRLQEAIIARSADQSIFAWDVSIPRSGERGTEIKEADLLAPSPDVFAHAGNIVPFYSTNSPYSMANQGLQILAPVVNDTQILLRCRYTQDPTIAILLKAFPTDSDSFFKWLESFRLEPGQVALRLVLNDSRWNRLSFCDMSQVARIERPLQLTIIPRTKSEGLTESLKVFKLLPRVRMWLVFEKANESSRRPQYKISTEASKSLVDEPFGFVESKPLPQRDTRTLTYLTHVQSGKASHPRSSFAIRVRHPSGHCIDLNVVLHKNREGSVQLRSFSSIGIGHLNPLPKPPDELDEWNLRFFPSTYAHMCSWRFTAIVRLDREDLSGESPFVLRLSMVRTSPRVLFKYASWGYEQNSAAWEALLYFLAFVTCLAGGSLIFPLKSTLLSVTYELVEIAFFYAMTSLFRGAAYWLFQRYMPEKLNWLPLNILL